MAHTRKTEELRDMVCGLQLRGLEHAVSVEYRNKKRFFCCAGCAQRFRKTPERFFGTPIIQLKNVWKVFRNAGVETQVLRGIDASIWEGDFVVIIGASGSGKSTVLNMIGLLDTQTSGQILLDGEDVSKFSESERALKRSRSFGFIFQQYNLIPWLTAYENVTMPRVFAGLPVVREEVEKEFESVGLRERMMHRPVQMSGGEQQRTALIRALSTNPRIILGDEPTGNLDSVTGKKILDRLEDLHHQEGRTLIIVSHDPSIAERADQIIAIRDGIHVQNHQVHRAIRAKI